MSKWFDTGKLRGYRIPGSRDRRIPLQQLIAFMRAHGIPLDGLDQGCCRIMALSEALPAGTMDAINSTGRYELRVASNGFEAGMIAQAFRPHVVVVDVDGDEDEAADVCQHIKGAAELTAAKVLAAVTEMDPFLEQRLTSAGFDGCVARPVTARRIIEAAEEATNLIS